MAEQTRKVIIIGGGLAGPVLALCLQKHNIRSTIFELRPKSNGRDGGYLALAPNALRVLNSVGIYDQISPLGYNYEDLDILSARNLGTIGRVKNGSEQKFGFKALRISRHSLRQTLMAELERKGIEVRYGSKLVDITEEGNLASDKGGAPCGSSVKVTFADGHVERADLVVGADGIHSRVRQYLYPVEGQPKFTGQMGLGGAIDRSQLHGSAQDMYLPCMILGKENSFAMMPASHDGNSIGFFATIEEKDRPREEWDRLNADKQQLSEMLLDRHCRNNHEWPQVVSDVCRDADLPTLSIWPFYRVPTLPSFSSASCRIILIGDAAHALPPTGGQGAAMALEDALSLANALAAVDTAPTSSSTHGQCGALSSAKTINSEQKPQQTYLKTTLDRWQMARTTRLTKITAFSTRGGDMRRATPSKLQQILKEWTMWLYLWWRGADAGMSWIYEYDVSKEVFV